MPPMARTGEGQVPSKEARRAALMEARECLAQAEALVVAGDPGGSEVLEQARSALARSSSYPPAAVPAESEDDAPNSDDPKSEDDATSSLRARLGAFLKSLR
jgi:hypothetical protein